MGAEHSQLNKINDINMDNIQGKSQSTLYLSRIDVF
jgi:hypothetical protein